MGFRGQFRFFTVGSAGRTAGLKAQWPFLAGGAVPPDHATTPKSVNTANRSLDLIRVRRTWSAANINLSRLQWCFISHARQRDKPRETPERSAGKSMLPKFRGHATPQCGPKPIRECRPRLAIIVARWVHQHVRDTG